MNFIRININTNNAKNRLHRFMSYFDNGILSKTLQEIGDDQIDEHLKRFDYFKVDYRNKPLMGLMDSYYKWKEGKWIGYVKRWKRLMDSYYKWKVNFTGIPDQNIGILTGNMRMLTYSRISGNSLFIENFVKNDNGRPYAHYFQKHRSIFGFSEQGIKKARLIIQNAIRKFTI